MKNVYVLSVVLVSIVLLSFSLPQSTVANSSNQIAIHQDSQDSNANEERYQLDEDTKEELQQELREEFDTGAASSNSFSSPTSGGMLFRLGVFLNQNSTGVTIALFVSGLITSLLLGMLLKTPMKNATKKVNKAPVTMWATGLAGLIIVGGLGKVFVSLLAEYFDPMAYSFIVLSGLVVGVGLLFLMSVYIATVLISVLIGSWIANVVTSTSPKKSAIVQWWSIAAGYVIAFAVAFAFLNLFPLEDQVGRTTNSVVFGLVIYPVLLGAVWQVAWSLGVKRYIQNRFSSKETNPK